MYLTANGQGACLLNSSRRHLAAPCKRRGLPQLMLSFRCRAACSPVRFWAVAAAAPAGDATTNIFVDALCPDILEALVHCALVLQGCSPEVRVSGFAEVNRAAGKVQHA